VSKRHQSSRRRTYGRRQHEVYERETRRHFPEPGDIRSEDSGAGAPGDPFAFLDPRLPRLRFAVGE
jgi:hypothetical protein